MAEPRVFLSSTFYDLRHVRSDLDAFIREMGYVPIRNEGGDIPFGINETLEEYCYREIERCDVLVSIIGGRYGHPSKKEKDYAVSQLELKTALSLRKQVYIFVEKGVWYEFESFRSCPDEKRQNFHSFHANDLRIHKFILEIMSLPHSNPIFPFESSQEITEICRRQWAGLFQSLLQQQSRRPEEDLISKLENQLSVTAQLIAYLTEERKRGSEAVQDILLSNHPAFTEVRKLAEIPFRIMFTNKDELDELLVDRGFKAIPSDEWKEDEQMEWMKREGNTRKFLRINKEIFDSNGQLKVFSNLEWKRSYIVIETH